MGAFICNGATRYSVLAKNGGSQFAVIHAIYVEMIAPILLFTRYRVSANGCHQIAVYPQQSISKRCLRFASHPLQYATTFEVTRRLVRANGCHQLTIPYYGSV